jgi:signal transduction histidine kinase
MIEARPREAVSRGACMRAFARHHLSRALLLTVPLLLMPLSASLSAAAADPQKRVLVLYSSRRDAQIAIVGERELPRMLEEASPGGLDYYSEFIDRPRVPDQAHQEPFRDFLRLKYAQHQFDLVIAVDDLALEFVRAFRDDLFPQTPIVYFATAPIASALRNATGLIGQVDYRGTLDLALQLQPDMRRVFVVAGTAPDGREPEQVKQAKAQLQPFAARVAIDYLVGLPAHELENRLATLPGQSIVYYLSVGRDGAGQNFHPLEYLDRLVSIANAPIYCWVSSAMGHGIVGGSLKDQENETRALGDLGVRVLRGERADGIPVGSPNLNVREVDWRQLRRWAILESRVPRATLVRFVEPSLWDRYRIYILGALTLLLVETALIGALLYQRRARRRAEIESRRNLTLAADANRRATMTALTGSIAHELSQPLNSILHNAQAGELLLDSDRATPELLREILADIRTADGRASQIIERHRTMLKNRELGKAVVDVHAVVRESVALVAHDMEAKQVEIHVDLPEGPCFAVGDAVLLQQVLVNLMMNAVDAMTETPQDQRRLNVRNDIKADSLELSVRDAGAGLPETIDGRMFEPFVTTKANGVGIGLTIAQTIVEAHRGRLEGRNNAEGGATFTVTLPRDRKSAVA